MCLSKNSGMPKTRFENAQNGPQHQITIHYNMYINY